MKKFTVIAGGRFFTDVVDGPGWTDVEVDGYYDSNGKYVPPQYSSSPAQGFLCSGTKTNAKRESLT